MARAQKSEFDKQLATLKKEAKKAGVPVDQMALFGGQRATLPIEPGVARVDRIEMARVFIPEDFNGRKELWGDPKKGEDLETLAESIKTKGLLEPIVVYFRNFNLTGPADVRYGLVAGERRFRALEHIGATHVMAVIRAGTSAQAQDDNYTENQMRKNLAPWEISEACVKASEMGRKQTATGKALNISRSAVSNYIAVNRLLKVEPDAWEAYKLGTLGPRRALEMRSEAKRMAKRDDISEDKAFKLVWEAFVHAGEDTTGTGGGGSKGDGPDKPGRKEIRETMAWFGLACSDAGALSDRPSGTVDWAHGVLWALRWREGQSLMTDIKDSRWKSMTAAEKRAIKARDAADAAEAAE